MSAMTDEDLRKAAEGVLREVIDPEVGINVVDLGLVVDVEADHGALSLRFRLTSPTCPIGSAVAQAMEGALRTLAQVTDVTLTLVDEPAWSPDCISPEGRRLLAI